tara:strand:+ start:210 stop:1463 length:1254 start_codon:yes stop_codon:yes gene_type:complete
MKVIVFGGDGFCGWPTALKLSKNKHEVLIIDNLLRRTIDKELGVLPLTPIKTISERIKKWKEVSGREIEFLNIDVSKEFIKLLDCFKSFKPDAVVHFAEQRSAPYSMISPSHKSFTITNNLNATNNILSAIVESKIDIHMIHLGSTGYYGYSNIGLKIPEGYLKVYVNAKGEKKELEILYPPNPGSIYHLTKCQDALMFQFYNKNDKVRITDLHQGIVWGTQTKETILHEDLINRFDYDGIFGTVLNRFIVESQIDHPITVYGTGGQTRAFIHVQNTTDCIKLALENPPLPGERYRVFNQTTECHNLKDLAKKIQKLTNAEIRYYKNQRIEANSNSLDFIKEGFEELGLKPIYLDDGLVMEIFDVVKKYKDRIDTTKIMSKALWTKDCTFDNVGKPEKDKVSKDLSDREPQHPTRNT